MRKSEQVEMAILLTFEDARKAKMLPIGLHVEAMVTIANEIMGNEEQSRTAVNRVVRRGMARIEPSTDGDILVPTAAGLKKAKRLRKLFA